MRGKSCSWDILGMREEQEWETKGAGGAPGDAVKGQMPPRTIKVLCRLKYQKRWGNMGENELWG